MPVYIDDAQIAWRGRRWCHLVADSLEELHTFASLLGLKPDWFQRKTLYPHYDVTTRLRERALELGAVAANKRVVVVRAKALRQQLNEIAKAENDGSSSRGEVLCTEET
jgi:signal recognition particle subunit SEC65